MKLSKVLMTLILSASLFMMSCGPKDADIKANVDNALKADPMTAPVMADVKDAVVTLNGEVMDDAAKANAEKKALAVKGVKSVTNNCTVAPPPPPPVAPPASMSTTLDDATQQKVKDGLKDIKGVTVTFTEDKAVITGEVSKADRMKIMQMLASAKVKSDVSNLVDKK